MDKRDHAAQEGKEESGSGQVRVLIDETAIERRVGEMAADIRACYGDEPFLFLVVLKGAFMFAADLFRRIGAPQMRIDFIRLSSYRGTCSTGKVTIPKDELAHFTGQDILIVEDIVDTGLTLDVFTKALQVAGARSVRICSFLEKNEINKGRVKIDFLGFPIPDKFVVGYGLDCDEKHRDLPHVAVFNED
jgi:hypoxanthine phosphoribosyltransferase